MIIIDRHILLGNKKNSCLMTLDMELSRALVGGGMSLVAAHSLATF